MKKIPFLLLMLLFTLSVPVFATTEFQNLPVHDGFNYYLITQPESQYILVYSASPMVLSNDFTLGGSPFYTYRSTDGVRWVRVAYHGNGTKFGLGTPESSYPLLYSNYDVKRFDGTVFFSHRVPPKYLVTVAEMGQVSLGSLMKDFGQALAELLPVGLILSSMVLAIYLVRRFLPSFGLSSK